MAELQAINRYGIERWDFSAGQWVNGVGISRNGQVIAVGSVDRTLYVLDGGGKVTTKVLAASVIRERSVAVSRDGKRIAFADENILYGYELADEPVPDIADPDLCSQPY